MVTTAPVCQVRPTLQFGTQGSSVKALQERLNFEFGYRQQLVVDGIFGTRTERAVKVIQYRRFLAQDGIVGPQTWAALCSSRLAYPTLKRSSTGVLVERVQYVLKKAGFYNGSVDGIFGELTEKAVKALQMNSHLPATGTIDQATWDALFEQATIQTITF